MHPMFVKLFLEASEDDLLAEEDRRRAASRSRRAARRQPRQATRVTGRDRDRRTPR